jgi:hypothetical protein
MGSWGGVSMEWKVYAQTIFRPPNAVSLPSKITLRRLGLESMLEEVMGDEADDEQRIRLGSLTVGASGVDLEGTGSGRTRTRTRMDACLSCCRHVIASKRPSGMSEIEVMENPILSFYKKQCHDSYESKKMVLVTVYRM